MNSKFRKLLLGGVVTTGLATIVSFLMTNESSPFHEYFLWHPQMRNFWGMLNLPSYLAGALAAGNPHSVNEIVAWTVFFLQWMIFGICLTAIGGMIFPKNVSRT